MPGDNSVVLSHILRIPKATPTYLKVAIEGDDTDEQDNAQECYAVYDRYCTPKILPRGRPYIQSLYAFGATKQLPRVKTGAMRYSLGRPLRLYKQEACDLWLLPNGTLPAGWSLAVWVDWNNDGLFTPDERYSRPLARRPQHTQIDFDLEAQNAGLRCMRMAIGPTAELTDACAVLTAGDMQDCTIELVDGYYPGHNDLELWQLNAGSNGKDLPNNQPIAVTIANRSNTEFNGMVRVRVTVDNGDTQASRTLISLSENTRLVAAFARSEGKVAEFTARDEEGNLLPGVAIALAGLNLTSGTDGKARTDGQLPYGDYRYVATLSGFLQEEGIISLSEYSASITVVMRRPATVNFTVTDTQGNPLVGARVQVDSRVKNTAGNGQVQFQLPRGSHGYKVLHADYQMVESVLTVGTLAPIHHAVELERLYKATFTVKHGAEPLPNAKLEIGGQTLRTNAAGVAMIELLGNQNYPYKAEKVGYQQRTGTLHVGTADASELVVLEPTKYDVVVAVTDGFRMLGNATITLGGLQQTTDANGKATYRLPTGDYSYTVQHADYNSANGNLTVQGETAIQITLSGERTVTFRVTDGVHPLPTAEFTLLDDNAVLPLAADGTATKSLAPGNYRYRASLLGYAEVRSSVAVTNRDTTVAVILRKTHTVRFTVHDANGPVHDATIGIDGKDIVTDASGSATVELPNGVYPFTVRATGYEEFVGNITVKDADVGRAVELNPTFRVIFTVKSDTTNIRDAKIQISNQTLETDSFGEALNNLPNGTYTYSVAKSGFRTEEGQVKVEGAAVAVEVQLKQLYRVVFRVLDGNGIPLPDAAIAVDKQQITTDAEGVAPVYLPNGDYAYTVRKDGFDEAAGSFTVAEAVQTMDVVLMKRIPQPAEYVVTFMIIAKGKGVPGATVTLGNDVQTTDSTGSCAFKLRDSTYTYTVRKAGYGDASGSFTVAGAGGRVVVALAEEGGVEPDAVERGQLAAVGVAPNPFTDELVLTNAARCNVCSC